MSHRTPFCMFVDSGADDEPTRNRYFGSFEAAMEAAAALPERFHPFVWIMEKRPEGHSVVRVMDGVVQTSEVNA